MIYAGNRDMKGIKVCRILELVGDIRKKETRHRVRIAIILPEIYFLSLYILFQGIRGRIRGENGGRMGERMRARMARMEERIRGRMRARMTRLVRNEGENGRMGE